MARYFLRTLGGLALVRSDDPSQEAALANSKALLILALLATRPGYGCRRSELAELLWPDGNRARALRALRQALFFLSGHANDILIRTDETLALDAEGLTVDLWEFDRAMAAEDHATAIRLCGGGFCEGVERKVGVEVEHWIEAVNARVSVGLEVAYARHITALLAAGAGAEAAGLARAYVARNPLDEERQHLLARTLTAAGDRVGALQALEEYRKVLAGALEEEPPPELEDRIQAMREELLHLEPAAPPLPPPAAEAPLPQPGAPAPAAEPVVAADRGPVFRRTRVAAAAGGVVVLAVVALLTAPRGSRAPAEPLTDLEARLLAVARDRNGNRMVEITIRGGTATMTNQGGLQPNDLPAPDGRTVVTMVQASHGWDLAVRAGAEAPRPLTNVVGDELPVAWSPDSRFLIYAERRLPSDGRTQAHRLMVYDLARNDATPLAALASAERPTAAWSPDGARIAFTADVRGAPDVFVVDFDGGNLHDLTRHPAWDGRPAWSPDGEQIAFISRRGGRTDLYAMRPDGSELQRLTRTVREEAVPVWLSPTAVALVNGGDAGVLEVLDTYGGRVHEFGATRGLVSIVGKREGRRSWIDRLTVEPRIQVGSPGQRLAVSVVATDPEGAPRPLGPLAVEWSLTGSGVARLDGPGQVRLLSAGRVGVVADLAGWRADTLTLYSLPLLVRPGAPVFQEDWRQGLDTTRWRAYGDPPPRTRSTGGPGRSGVFLNNGDAFFGSGAITTAGFPLAEGLSVEVDGRLQFTGKLHQEFGLALYREDVPDSALASGEAPALVEFRVRGPSGAGPAEAWIATSDGRSVLPVPPDLEDWHSYVLQVQADGTVELILDQRVYWRSGAPLKDRNGAARVALGLQSFETEILHGRVRVYAPPRYQLPQLRSD
jgi:DNA-binding SARP family transcriptional activator/dipeptidyl aminopeptidase/acylaminoacyl peptidase